MNGALYKIIPLIKGGKMFLHLLASYMQHI